jgi:prevent-host-death family protein
MDSYSIADAKARLSELVERAEAGETVDITKRGKLVAKLTPAKRKLTTFDVDSLRAFTATLMPSNESAVEMMRNDARY